MSKMSPEELNRFISKLAQEYVNKNEDLSIYEAFDLAIKTIDLQMKLNK